MYAALMRIVPGPAAALKALDVLGKTATIISGISIWSLFEKSLELQIINATSDHTLTWGDEDTYTYFDDGHFKSHPSYSVVLPNSCNVATFSNKTMCPSGVDGAIAFRIDNTNKFLIIGFRNSIKPFVDDTFQHVVTVVTIEEEEIPKGGPEKKKATLQEKLKEELKRVYKIIENGKVKKILEGGYKIESKLSKPTDCSGKILVTVSEESKPVQEFNQEVGRHLSKDHKCFGDK